MSYELIQIDENEIFETGVIIVIDACISTVFASVRDQLKLYVRH